MKEQFITFLREPTLDNYMQLRSLVFADEKFDPYSFELDEVNSLFEKEDYKGAMNLINDNLWPSNFLSPGAHMNLSFAHFKMGDEQTARMENMVASAMLHGIELTGDGSKEKPYLVSRVSDEHDFLDARQMNIISQVLITEDNKKFDVITTDTDVKIWFDITEISRIMESKMDMQAGMNPDMNPEVN